MTDRDQRLVDAFLEDLGSAPVPPGLEADVARRIRDERQQRVGRGGAWLAWAAVLVLVVALAGVAWVVAGPGPTPVPSLVLSPSSAPASSAPTVPAASATPSVGPSASARASAGNTSALFHLTLASSTSAALPAEVLDHSGMVTGVAEGVTGPMNAAPVGIGRGRDVQSIAVQWTGGSCDQLAEIDVDALASTVTVSTATMPSACDANGIERVVEIRFAEPVDVAAMQGRVGNPIRLDASIQPSAVAFMDADQGSVGGTQGNRGLAVVAQTFDGGASWAVTPLAWGKVVGLGLGGNDLHPLVAVSCADSIQGCVPGVYTGYGLHQWTRVLAVDPTRLAVDGQGVVVIEALPTEPTKSYPFPPTGLRLSEDGGDTWSTLRNPCPAASPSLTGVTFDLARELVVVCEGEGATGGAAKTLLRATDPPTAWRKIAELPLRGTGMNLDLSGNGAGWLWGARSPLMVTADDGVTWTPLSIVDGEARMVVAANSWASTGGVALVWDPDRQATLLLGTQDGTTWTEMHAFPAAP